MGDNGGPARDSTQPREKAAVSWQFRSRVALCATFGLVMLAFPVVGDNHVQLGALALLVTLPLHFLVRKLSGRSNPVGWLDLVGTGTATAVAFIEPSVWPAALLFQMFNVGGSVAFLTTRWTFILGVSSIVPMTMLAIANPLPDQLTMLMVSGLFLPTLILGSSQKSEKDRKVADETRATLQRQHEIVTRMSAMVITIDDPKLAADSTIGHLTDRFGWIGDAASEAKGKTLGSILPVLGNHPRVRQACAELGKDPIVLEPIAVHEHDGERYVEVEIFELSSGGAALLIEDVTDREASTALVRYQAAHDHLTGLANREAIMGRAAQLLADGIPSALLLIDLNGFKDINDTLGHFAGDELLKIVSERIRLSVRRGDLVARLGGDEFAVLVNDIRPERLNAMVAEIGRRARETTVIGNACVGTSASIGVARAPFDATDAETLLQCADIAMYEAKRTQAGHRYYESSLSTAPERLDLLAEIAPAFERGEMTAYLQPKVCVTSGTVTGAEVLMRWNHPARGVLAPNEFLDIVSVAGLLDELARQALWSAVQVAADVDDDLSIAVNMSAVNLRQRDLARQISQVLDSHGVAPNRLIIELTESEVIDETGVLHRTLAEIAELGVGIAVDDFGTGYSSFSHLRSLPLTELKIDQRFVGGLTANHSDEVIVASMIELGHNLGLSVCAEGVEDVETARQLSALGCEMAQGYYFGRPMPATDFAAWVTTAEVATAT